VGTRGAEREPAALKVATQNHVSNQGAGSQIQQRKEQISAADSSTDVTLSVFLFFNNNLIDKSKMRGHNGNQELHCSRPVSPNVNSVSPRMTRMGWLTSSVLSARIRVIRGSILSDHFSHQSPGASARRMFVAGRLSKSTGTHPRD
jgi:hypothetical protein